MHWFPLFPSRLSLIGASALLAFVMAPGALDAKRKTQPQRQPLTIVNVTAAPLPFVPGTGSLALTVDVELPGNFNGADVLEVSSLISFPSKRSIRFLFGRQSLDNAVMEDGTPRMSMTLLWDGYDQNRQYVTQGTYAYEVRAKLMAGEKGVVKTRSVSRFAKGTLEVSSPQDVGAQPPRPDPAPSDEADSAPPEDAGARLNAAGQP